jgi:threonine dehydrogenase-like Zn-dependent dehydrogenase
VVELGAGAGSSVQIGDRVCSMPFVLKEAGPALIGSNPETSGAYAEYMVLTEALCLKVPDGVPDAAAALTEPLGIAVHAVNNAALQAGDVAVVIGCGPIGLAITAMLKIRGVAAIFAADYSPRRCDLARTMGATQVVDAREANVVPLAAAAHPGARMVIFENTGAPRMLGKLVIEATLNARIVVTGIANGEESLLPLVAIMKGLHIAFVIYYTPEEFAEALQLIARGKLDWQPLVTGTVSLDEVNAAFKALEDPETHAKILIDPRLGTA